MSKRQIQPIRISLLFICVLLLLPSLVTAQRHNCDFAAVLTRDGYVIPFIPDGMFSFDDPDDFYYEWLTTTINPDGYGNVYAADGVPVIPFPQQDDYFSEDPYWVDPVPWNTFWLDTFNVNDPSVMVMSHTRWGTGGDGNHPFLFNFDGRTYAFMHNGGILDNVKDALWNELYNLYGNGNGQWFWEHPPNWLPNPLQWADPDNFIDSELLFHWIMKHIIQSNGSEFSGIQSALTGSARINDTPPYIAMSLYNAFFVNFANNKINFVLSDGDSLYVFRNTPINGNTRNISYKNVNDVFTGIKTQWTEPGFTTVPQFTLLHVTRENRPRQFANFHTRNFAEVEISVSDSPDPVMVNQWLTYTVIMVNNGPEDSTNSILADDMAPELVFRQFSRDGINWQAWTGERNIGTLPAYTSSIAYLRGWVTNTGQDRLIDYSVKISSQDVEDPDMRNNKVYEDTTLR